MSNFFSRHWEDRQKFIITLMRDLSRQTEPQKLVDCVNQHDLWAHMVKFQQIADANPGADGHPSRNSGEPGYKASADYVARVMREAGYKVQLQEYKFHYVSFVGSPVMRVTSMNKMSPPVGVHASPVATPACSVRSATSLKILGGPKCSAT